MACRWIPLALCALLLLPPAAAAQHVLPATEVAADTTVAGVVGGPDGGPARPPYTHPSSALAPVDTTVVGAVGEPDGGRPRPPYTPRTLVLPNDSDYVHGPTIGGVNTTRAWIVGGIMGASNVGIMYYYYTTFYTPRESERSKWHTFNDWYNADLNVDKLGHVWGAQAYTNTLYHIFRWANLGTTSSMLWSSSLAWLYQLEMEMTDAYYKRWGFSWWDVGANTVGSVWPNLQRAVPALQSVNLKMSYRPSRLITEKWVDYVLKDYDGFTYWLAFSVEDFLPRALKPYWPDWLGIAVGYGAANTVIARNTYNSNAQNKGLGDQEWYIALDYDLRKLPGDTPFLRFLKEELNLIHWPSPAIRISPGMIWYGLFF